MSSPTRVRARVEGTVQGVGFRPFVYRLATELGLTGWVLNDEHGVLLEVEGTEVDQFLERLRTDAPPLSQIDSIEVTQQPATSNQQPFAIKESEHHGTPDAAVSPDSATCSDCLRELFDDSNRRFRYPFTNCTNCGPRFTIVLGVPYDRPLTTMAGFEMCDRCRAEYEDPADRRFHAQPNACPDCGPSLSPPLEDAVAALREGRIVAIKGLGGYHLACRAAAEETVAALRARKHREDKPFALMAADLEAARALVELTAEEKELLLGRERPIVIARRRADAPVAPSVAPGSPDLGVMLPYTPLHHLLLADVGETLVMTSANVSDEPIAFEDGDAHERLVGIADVFLVHDRPIHMRTDDSVVRATRALPGTPLVLRRSRGYVPASLGLPLEAPRPVVAYGAELKNTICVAKGGRAWVGHHIGDLENWETLRSFRGAVEHFERLFAVAPEVVAHDLHPEYLSTKEALEREGVEHVGVQHHHAHLAACLAEHGEEGPAVGAIFDGTGYGSDGSVWGGELLLGGLASFERVGHLVPVLMPGGAQAVKQPWRMACAWLGEALGEDEPALPPALAGKVDAERWRAISALARSPDSPATTSVGRLFDAVAALAGLRAEVNYEGQAAVELEAAATAGERGAYAVDVVTDETLLLDPRSAVATVARDVADGAGAGTVAARFHTGFAKGTAEACALAAERGGTETIVLSGGVFQNRLLLESVSDQLSRKGLKVLRPEKLPPNDGGISYGQVAVATARDRY